MDVLVTSTRLGKGSQMRSELPLQIHSSSAVTQASDSIIPASFGDIIESMYTHHLHMASEMLVAHHCDHPSLIFLESPVPFFPPMKGLDLLNAWLNWI